MESPHMVNFIPDKFMVNFIPDKFKVNFIPDKFKVEVRMIDTDSGWKRLDDVLAPLPAEDRDAILHAFDYLEETAAFAARAVETARLLR